jgi:hypothetical protein
MRKRLRILLAFALVLVLGVFAWVMLRTGEREPLYQGRPLSYWLQGYVPTRTFPPATNAIPGPTRAEAKAAVEYLGTNAIPTLLRLLSTRDFPLATRLYQIAQRQRFIHIPYTDPWERAQEAEWGFWELGPKLTVAAPQLIELFDLHPTIMSHQIIPDILGRIDPPVKAAVPMLVKATTDSDSFVRNNSVFALGRIHIEPALAVPALIKCLDDPTDYIRAHAARALAAFGQDARPAVPALVKLLAREGTNGIPANAVLRAPPGDFDTIYGPNPGANWAGGAIDVVGPTTQALKIIDPEAAVQAGIK